LVPRYFSGILIFDKISGAKLGAPLKKWAYVKILNCELKLACEKYHDLVCRRLDHEKKIIPNC
jgi:hypothetical protein